VVGAGEGTAWSVERWRTSSRRELELVDDGGWVGHLSESLVGRCTASSPSYPHGRHNG
jgi:hypothetical protein